MVNLKAIQERLNSDETYRQEFLRDPVGLFRKEGLILGDDHVKQLQDLVSEISSPAKSATGSNLAGNAKPEWGIGIGKSWSTFSAR